MSGLQQVIAAFSASANNQALSKEFRHCCNVIVQQLQRLESTGLELPIRLVVNLVGELQQLCQQRREAYLGVPTAQQTMAAREAFYRGYGAIMRCYLAISPHSPDPTSNQEIIVQLANDDQYRKKYLAWLYTSECVSLMRNGVFKDRNDLSYLVDEEKGNARLFIYDIRTRIGSGSHGHVTYAIDATTGKPCVVKLVDRVVYAVGGKCPSFDDAIFASQNQEIDHSKEQGLLIASKRFIRSREMQGELPIVRYRFAMVQVDRGEPLHEYCHRTNASALKRLGFMVELVSMITMDFHARGKIYGDLKAPNVGIDWAGALGIFDLGYVEPIATTGPGRYGFGPGQYSKDSYLPQDRFKDDYIPTAAIDVFCLGELLAGKYSIGVSQIPGIAELHEQCCAAKAAERCDMLHLQLELAAITMRRVNDLLHHQKILLQHQSHQDGTRARLLYLELSQDAVDTLKKVKRALRRLDNYLEIVTGSTPLQLNEYRQRLTGTQDLLTLTQERLKAFNAAACGQLPELKDAEGPLLPPAAAFLDRAWLPMANAAVAGNDEATGAAYEQDPENLERPNNPEPEALPRMPRRSFASIKPK